MAIRTPVSLYFTLNTLPNDPSPITSIISKLLNFTFSADMIVAYYSGLFYSSYPDNVNFILLILATKSPFYSLITSFLDLFLDSAYLYSMNSISYDSILVNYSQNSTISVNLNFIYSVKLSSSL
jgi:hypothetical protein